MDDALFLIATFGAALVAGLAGFAFGIVAAAIWLHVITPVETASLIVGFGLIVQASRSGSCATRWIGASCGHSWRAARSVSRSASRSSAGPIRRMCGPAPGRVLVLYALYALAAPENASRSPAGPLRDAGVGFLNGILAGITGFAGIVVTIWCGLRGCRDCSAGCSSRSGSATFIMCAAWLGGNRRHLGPYGRAVPPGLAVPAGRNLARAETLRASPTRRAFRKIVLAFAAGLRRLRCCGRCAETMAPRAAIAFGGDFGDGCGR